MAELFGGVFGGGGSGDGLFAAGSSFRAKERPALPAAALRTAPAAAAAEARQAPRARAPARLQDSDDDSDGERQWQRKAKRQAAAGALRAGDGPAKPSRRAVARARLEPVQIEPAETTAPERKRKRDQPDVDAPAKPHVADADNADKAARTVFVGNLPAAIKPKRLKQLFSPCGPVESVRLRSVAVDPEAKVPRRAAVLTGQRNGAVESVNGYVVFVSADAVPKAVEMNMRVMEGRHVRVDALAAGTAPGVPGRRAAAGSGAGSMGSAQLDPRRSVYLGNLHFGIDDEEVIALFSAGGASRPLLVEGCVEAVRIPRDRETGRSRGFGYVCFRDAAAVRDALGLAGAMLRGRPLRVTRASAKRAVIAATARATAADAHAALAALPAKAPRAPREAPKPPASDVAAGEGGAPKMARWKARAMKAAAAGDAAAAEVLKGAAAAAAKGAAAGAAGPRRPSPWEGVHATPAALPAAAASGGGKVRTKPRWRDLGRDVGTPLALVPRQLAPKPVPANKPKPRGVGAKPGVGKQGGTKRISGRKRPAVVARKAAAARKKTTG